MLFRRLVIVVAMTASTAASAEVAGEGPTVEQLLEPPRRPYSVEVSGSNIGVGLEGGIDLGDYAAVALGGTTNLERKTARIMPRVHTSGRLGRGYLGLGLAGGSYYGIMGDEGGFTATNLEAGVELALHWFRLHGFVGRQQALSCHSPFQCADLDATYVGFGLGVAM